MLLSAIAWIGCAVVLAIAAVRSLRHSSALRLGRRTTGVLYLAAGAAMNGWFLLRGDDYGEFADGAYLPFVRHTWETVVVPNHHWWIALLIVFEVALGVLALAGGRRTQAAYGLAIAFHVALLSFGWGFYAWSLPMIACFVVLLRGERAQPSGQLLANEARWASPLASAKPAASRIDHRWRTATHERSPLRSGTGRTAA
jgi:hypothetical protein